ncbi:hypothetical protein K8I61_06750 [bacterium]|nr:hypothetical protein [bacterium]
MKGIAIACVLGGVTGMIWGSIWWMALPFANMAIGSFPDEEAVQNYLRDTGAPDGVYFVPGMPAEDTEEAMKAMHERTLRGPIAQVFLTQGGFDPAAPGTYVFGFLHFIVSTLLLAVPVRMAAPSLPTFAARWKFTTLVGIFGSFAIAISFPVWYHHVWDYWITQFVFYASTWALIALVVAKFVKAD